MIRNQSVYKGLYYIALDFLSWDITKPDRYSEFDNNFNRLCFRLWNIDQKSDRILHLTQENMSFWLVMPIRIPYHQNLRGWFWLKLIIYEEIFCSSRQYTLRINIIYIYNITKRCLQYLRYISLRNISLILFHQVSSVVDDMEQIVHSVKVGFVINTSPF